MIRAPRAYCEPSGPVDILASQFAEFLSHVAHRTAPEADVQRCGVDIALLLQSITESARTNRPVALQGTG